MSHSCFFPHVFFCTCRLDCRATNKHGYPVAFFPYHLLDLSLLHPTSCSEVVLIPCDSWKCGSHKHKVDSEVFQELSSGVTSAS